VALVDGFVQRDLRRWGGGRESSFVYHWAKRSALPLLVLSWVVYLALPFSLHPTFVILPFAAPFALSVAVTASSFKKYLQKTPVPTDRYRKNNRQEARKKLKKLSNGLK